jgi:hypothetical protein
VPAADALAGRRVSADVDDHRRLRSAAYDAAPHPDPLFRFLLVRGCSARLLGLDGRHRLALDQHLEDGLIPLLHQPELHQHDADPLLPVTLTVTSEEGSAQSGADPAM